jgi:hypothetical protein
MRYQGKHFCHFVRYQLAHNWPREMLFSAVFDGLLTWFSQFRTACAIVVKEASELLRCYFGPPAGE